MPFFFVTIECLPSLAIGWLVIQGADGVADRVIELSVQIMLEELGPNLWEHKLER